MSKKSLLKEGTVRRFMKLAGTGILASDFLTEQDELGAEEELDLGGEEGGEEMDFADVELDEPGAEEGEEGEEEGGEEGEIEDAVRAMVDAIADVASDFGVDVEVGEEETAELEVPEFEGEEEEELGGEEGLGGEEEELGGEEEEELALQEGDDKPTPPFAWSKDGFCKDANGKAVHNDRCPAKKEELDEINYIDEDAVMNEVFHRVKNRLIQEKRTDDMASVLAERIARRMNKRR